MASRSNMKCSQSWCCPGTPRHWVLVLVWTVMWAMFSSECSALKSFSGEIGGNVTFPCPVDKGRKVDLFYVQRLNIFVNGYYKSRDIPEHVKPWENTKVDHGETAVHMYGLTMSHAGVYQCHIQYSGSNPLTTEVNLTVTASYSKPTVVTTCTSDNDDFSCLVTCTSHGGFPKVRMRFTGNLSGNSSDRMWRVVNSSEVQDPDTMMFASSSTAYFNCSYGELQLLSCTVGESTSHTFSVCTRKDTHTLNSLVPAAAAVVCLLLVAGFMVGLWLHCKERHSEAATCRANERAEEVVVLNDDTYKEAS